MNILIIEDDRIKGDRVRAHVESVCGSLGTPYVIELQRSYNSGLRACLSNSPELVLMDMTLPTFDVSPCETGGRPRHFAGKDILWELARRDVFIPTIVVTGFDVIGEGPEQQTREELSEDLRESFPRNFVATVFYTPSDLSWKSQLTELITEAIANHD